MKLATRLPDRTPQTRNDSDPREEASAEVIDLASRTAYPAVATRKGRSDVVGLAAGIGVVALIGGATLWGLNAARTNDQQAATQAAQTASEANRFIPPADQEVVPLANAQPGAAPQQDPAPTAVLAADPNAAMSPAGNPYASQTIVFDGAVAPAAAAPAGIPAAAPEANAASVGGTAGDFASRIGGVGGGPAVARNDFDPATTVTQGTMIPAVLETAINTDVPGYVRALVSQDVRSFDGKRVLIPRSTRLIGQYQSGLQAGQKRAYVIWTRLIRPDGVAVALASPATDFDGSGGLPGKVDSHFFQRFGSAMLLSVIGGLSNIATGGGTSVILGGGQSAASTALQQNGQISPTIRVRPGEPVRVVTARDLDFSQAPRL